ncbi:hypothetical protein SDC9_91322 [bioreactor metagenome]|uniref:Uncharacterized protein n=1 Tax=bioreactor metagenome TaxID=1076179 RepID=A0A645A1C2_9ZZZZ
MSVDGRGHWQRGLYTALKPVRLLAGIKTVGIAGRGERHGQRHISRHHRISAFGHRLAVALQDESNFIAARKIKLLIVQDHGVFAGGEFEDPPVQFVFPGAVGEQRHHDIPAAFRGHSRFGIEDGTIGPADGKAAELPEEFGFMETVDLTAPA